VAPVQLHGNAGVVTASTPENKVLTGPADLEALPSDVERIRRSLGSQRVNATSDSLEKGLSQIVLTIVELLRQLMERQALRRIESGTLSEDEVERLGVAFMKLAERMEEVKQVFGLTDEDLHLNLGPLGDLL
jgi:hypothetical protein